MNILHTCSFCGNSWTISEGFNIETKQCTPCDVYDIEEPARELERVKQRKWWDGEGRFIDAHVSFNYKNK